MVQTGEHRFILLILIKTGVLSAGPQSSPSEVAKTERWSLPCRAYNLNGPDKRGVVEKSIFTPSEPRHVGTCPK